MKILIMRKRLYVLVINKQAACKLPEKISTVLKTREIMIKSANNAVFRNCNNIGKQVFNWINFHGMSKAYKR